jgi:hypothetical protein
MVAYLNEEFGGAFVFKANSDNAIWFTVVEYDLDNSIVLISFFLDVLFDFLSSFRFLLHACQQRVK